MNATTIGAAMLATLLAFAPWHAALAASAPCLPPGVTPDILDWRVENAKTVAFRTESGRARAGLIEFYRAEDGRSVVVVWVRGALVYLDTAPENPSSPGWVDASFMSENGEVLLDSPGAGCEWRLRGGTEA